MRGLGGLVVFLMDSTPQCLYIFSTLSDNCLVVWDNCIGKKLQVSQLGCTTNQDQLRGHIQCRCSSLSSEVCSLYESHYCAVVTHPLYYLGIWPSAFQFLEHQIQAKVRKSTSTTTWRNTTCPGQYEINASDLEASYVFLALNRSSYL